MGYVLIDIKNYHFSMEICMLHQCTLVSIMDIFILHNSHFKAVESRQNLYTAATEF